jgi:hypothetical protein
MAKYVVQQCNPQNVGAPELVEAESERQAAEKVCGVSLRPRGRPGELRARVHLAGHHRQMTEIAFYADLNSD